jgi:hypothetical protein
MSTLGFLLFYICTFYICTFYICLKRGCFPKRWKIAKIIPIIKHGKEKSRDPSKYRPISLLNIGGKVLGNFSLI